MDTPDLTGPFRWVRITLSLALILLIGGVAAGSLNAYPIGDALLGLAGINAAAGFVLLIVTKNRVQSRVRTLQAQQQADLDSTFRSDKW